MNDFDKALHIYQEMKMSNPELDAQMVKHFMDKMAKEFTRTMYEMKFGCHIHDEEMYEEAVELLKWVENKGEGAKWDVDSLAKTSGIDFNTSHFTKYDYAYVVNMLYSDYCNVFTETAYYIKMGKNFLTDPDYTGDPSERAYHDAKKRIEHHK